MGRKPKIEEPDLFDDNDEIPKPKTLKQKEKDELKEEIKKELAKQVQDNIFWGELASKKSRRDKFQPPKISKETIELGIPHHVFIVHEDWTITKTRMYWKGDRLNSLARDYIVDCPPYRLRNKFGVIRVTCFFVSDKTGTTIDFNKLFSQSPQIDYETLNNYFDRRALKAALGIFQRDIMDIVIGGVMGVSVGVMIGAVFL